MNDNLLTPLRERISLGHAKESLKKEVVDIGYTEEEFESAYNKALTLQNQNSKDTPSPLHGTEASSKGSGLLTMLATFIFTFICIGGLVYLAYTYISSENDVNEIVTEAEQDTLFEDEQFEANETKQVVDAENNSVQTESSQEEASAEQEAVGAVVPSEEEKHSSSSDTSMAESTPAPKAQFSSSDPWEIIQKLKSALRKKDIQTANALSYHEYPSCDAGDTECEEMRDYFIDFFSDEIEKYKQEDFINKWEDEKQIIWTTEPTPVTIGSLDADFEQIVLMFVYDTGGELKYLQATFSSANKLETFTDVDKDGLRDEIEICKYRESDPNCKKSNPTVRDTDGNGYWDGIQYQMEHGGL